MTTLSHGHQLPVKWFPRPPSGWWFSRKAQDSLRTIYSWLWKQHPSFSLGAPTLSELFTRVDQEGLSPDPSQVQVWAQNQPSSTSALPTPTQCWAGQVAQALWWCTPSCQAPERVPGTPSHHAAVSKGEPGCRWRDHRANVGSHCLQEVLWAPRSAGTQAYLPLSWWHKLAHSSWPECVWVRFLSFSSLSGQCDTHPCFPPVSTCLLCLPTCCPVWRWTGRSRALGRCPPPRWGGACLLQTDRPPGAESSGGAWERCRWRLTGRAAWSPFQSAEGHLGGKEAVPAGLLTNFRGCPRTQMPANECSRPLQKRTTPRRHWSQFPFNKLYCKGWIYFPALLKIWVG